MKQIKELSIDNEEVYFLEPENEEDMVTLKKMEKNQELSINNSFGDWKGGNK